MTAAKRDGLQFLEEEDRHVLELLARIERSRGQGVESRDRYGTTVKALIRALGVREAAAVAVLEGLERADRRGSIAEGFRKGFAERRRSIDTVERMGRGVAAMELRYGQDFDAALRELRDTVTSQIEWELTEAIPEIGAAFGPEERAKLFSNARHLRRHAPTSLDPTGPRWHERAPVVSRVFSIVTRLRDYPTDARRSR